MKKHQVLTSKELTPSLKDIEITKKLMESSELLGLNFFDHLIFSEDDYVSL